MRRTGTVAILLVLAVLSAVIWLRLPSLGPVWGAALVEAYGLITGVPSTITGVNEATLAAVILSRPLMWLLFGYTVAAVVGCGRRALLVSLFVLVGLSIVCIVANQTAGSFLLGFTDISLRGGAALTLLGGIVFALPGLTCIVAHFIFER